ncbi:hypothetical protein CDV36_007325 [Fusarium kuroshium]|uniref:Uncharacterized protein n=1 Tax=Fusarium kuroshium TaxID=2010991 RepID=A0A3M2S688_9HYPO|nr:hypothetical protein CDV36_007325 [Fusarium kuroshium]
MESPDPISDLGLDCPFNGTFYICKDSPTRFIGCCTLNPCGTRKGLCPDEHLEPATYDSRYRIPPQGCVNDNFAVSWYTCPKTNPPFLGCCAVDPCSRGGCPDRELRAAKLSDKKSDADLFVGGKSPGLDSKGNPSTRLSITTATLTASYISTKTINAGIDATSDSESPPSHPASGKKGLSNGAIAGICIAAVVVLSFIIGVLIARFYWHHKRKKFRNPDDKQPSSRQSTASSSISRSQKHPHSTPGSISITYNSQGHIIGIGEPSRIPFGQNLEQEIHTRVSSEEQYHQQESRERWTQQPQPGQDTVSRPNFPVQTISVQVPSRDQNSMSNPSTPQPPYLTSDDQNGSHQGTVTRLDHREYKPWMPTVELPGNTEAPLSTDPLSTAGNSPSVELPGNTGRPHSTGHPSTSAPIAELSANTETRLSTGPPSGPVNNSWLRLVEPPANTETRLPTAPPSTPIDKSSSPMVELPTNTEVPLSTNPPSAPKHRLSDDTIYHKPEPKSLVFPPPPPVVRPNTAPLSSIPEEQPVENFDSRNAPATRSDGQLNHGQSRSADELRRVARSRGRSWSG